MVYDKTNIKEQINFILNELSKSIDALYTAPNLLTINKILENMRIDINNLVYLNEIRDKYTIQRADISKTLSESGKSEDKADPFLAKFHEPWPEEKISENLSKETEKNSTEKTDATQAKEHSQKEKKGAGKKPSEGLSKKKKEENKEDNFSEKPAKNYEEVKEVSRKEVKNGEKLSELDWLVSQLIDNDD